MSFLRGRKKLYTSPEGPKPEYTNTTHSNTPGYRRATGSDTGPTKFWYCRPRIFSIFALVFPIFAPFDFFQWMILIFPNHYKFLYL